jgi:hypothetical protein
MRCLFEYEHRSSEVLVMQPVVMNARYTNRLYRVCPKQNCGGLVFIRHIDGWQCQNCNKIIYREQLVKDSTENIREGHHRCKQY